MLKFLHKIKSKKGVTLVELIIAMGIFVVVMAAVSTVFLFSLDNINDSRKIDEAREKANLKIALEKYDDYIQDADGNLKLDEQGFYETSEHYKVKEITDIGEFKLEGEGSSIKINQGESFYCIIPPNGKVQFITYAERLKL